MTLPAIKLGDVFGDLIVVQILPDDSTAKAYNCRKQVRVKCVCGNRFNIPVYYLRRKPNPKTHCGCKNKTHKTVFPEEYRIWNMMHVRCENPKHEAYKHYGGRGIKVCEEWHKSSPDGLGFVRFLQFIGPRPSPNHSIDRIDNDQGYQPYHPITGARQVRWATAKEQRANQRKPKGSS